MRAWQLLQTSEVQSLRRKKDKEVVDVGKSLVEIAECASRDSINQAVDLVFVIDGSLTMKDLGKKVEERIADMARVFEESAIDYQFALIWYQNLSGSPQITVKPLQRGLLPIQENFRRPSDGKIYGSDYRIWARRDYEVALQNSVSAGMPKNTSSL